MTSPSVSVVIATYHNPPRYSDREFVAESAAGAEAQTRIPQPVEVLVVDGGSPDRCKVWDPPSGPPHADSFVLKKRDTGVCDALRCGVNQARGEWIVPMNADDRLAPHFVQSAFDTAGQWERNHTPYRCGVVVVSQQPLSAAIERDNYIPYLAMFARWFWDEMGGFVDVLGEGGACRLADWDLWIRIWQRFGDRAPVAYISDPSVIRLRNRPDSASKWSSDEFERLRAELWRIRGIEP